MTTLIREGTLFEIVMGKRKGFGKEEKEIKKWFYRIYITLEVGILVVVSTKCPSAVVCMTIGYILVSLLE